MAKVKDVFRQYTVEWERTFDSVPDLIAILDNQHKIIRVNRAMAHHMGVSPERCVGRTCFECVHGTNGPIELCPHVQTLKDGQEHVAELHDDLLGGDFIVSTNPLFDDKKRMIGSVHVARDITERKKAERMARSSLERFRSFIEVTGEIGWVTNSEGAVEEDVPSFRNFTGQTCEEVAGWGWTNALHPDDVERTRRAWREALQNRTRYETEYRLRRHDGVYRYFLARGVPIFNDDASVREWVGTCLDITGHKELEKELFDSLNASQVRQSEVAALLAASKAVLQHREFQKAARVIFDSCREMLGATAGYVALLSADGKENDVLFLDSGGLPCTVDPSLPMPVRGLRAEAYSSGKVVYENDFSQSPWARLMPNGHVVLRNVLFAPLNMSGKTLGVIGLANKSGGFSEHDSEMALAFSSLAAVSLSNSRVLETLEAQVEERTKKLKDAERLATIGETAGMVGHDIRNPLQSIIGELYLAKNEVGALSESDTKDSLKESLEIIVSQIGYINKIVSDLQDFTKPLSPCIEDVDIGVLVHEVIATMSIPESVTISCSIEDAFPKLKADPAFMKRILTNLISNAVQAMPNGGRLTIVAKSKDRSWAISVEDTGEGMSEAVKAKLFQPLFTTRSKGQGFGLAVVRRLVTALNGEVSFESQPGKGSRFVVEIPTAVKDGNR